MKLAFIVIVLGICWLTSISAGIKALETGKKTLAVINFIGVLTPFFGFFLGVITHMVLKNK